ncbi:hypothetical protein HY450_03960 [Candidatus Pacearchaeota archaeon]|nr:hypothetical protein [Candidatus Pacearchaeota archaeon]
MRTQEKRVIDGVEWTHIYTPRRDSTTIYREIILFPPRLYFATYRCKRCSHEWTASTRNTLPGDGLSTCPMPSCSEPGLFRTIYRQLRKQQITGSGKLIKVTAYE